MTDLLENVKVCCITKLSPIISSLKSFNECNCLLQVSLCLCLVLVWGRPAARRLPHDNDDVLAGSDFLSMFMHRRMSDRPDGPFEPHHLNSVTVNHGAPLADLVKPYSLSNVYKSNKYGYNSGIRMDDYPITTPDVLQTDVKTTTLHTEPTTIEDLTTTADFNTQEKTKYTTAPEQRPTTITAAESPTKLNPTTQHFGPEKIEEKVVVRVSSSVARHSHRTVETSTKEHTREVETPARLVDENLVSTLVTQDQPTITAVQRSEFAVEEAALPSSGGADVSNKKDQKSYERQDEVEGKVQEVSLFGNVQQQGSQGKLPVFEIHYANPPEALISGYSNKEEIQRTNSGRPGLRRKEFRQLSPYGAGMAIEPTSYHSSISSPTSASSIQFYREHSIGGTETIQQPLVTQPNPPPRQREEQHQHPSFVVQKQQGFGHSEQNYEIPEQINGQPERSYAQPEQNCGKPEHAYEPPKQNYGQPRTNYDQSERNYGHPGQSYGQPEQNYGNPEQNYGKPEQDYGQPEQQYGKQEPSQHFRQGERNYGQQEQIYSQPEENYEVDEAVSVMTNGRVHGIQTPTPTPGKTPGEDADKNKFGYVVEGRNFRKYRVEERTADGFIVGEYGVVSHDDGSLRGVRYTADSTINPRLIYDTLVKFLSLK